jgi:hypothetical protein
MIEMDRNDDAVLRILEKISKSNNLKLAYQIINKSLVSDKLNRLKQKIEKKDQEWINTVIESIRLFCLIAYLDKKEPIRTDIERDHKSLIVNDNIAKTAEGLIHILELIWRMHGSEVLTSFNQFNADRELKAQKSKAQRNEQQQDVYRNIGNQNNWEEADSRVHDRAKGSIIRREQLQSVLENLGNPNNWEEAPPDLGNKVERARVEAIRKMERNKIARNIANEKALNKRVWVNAPEQGKQYKSKYLSRSNLLNTLKSKKINFIPSANNSQITQKSSKGRAIRFAIEPTRKHVVVPEPSSLQKRNNFNTSTIMGNVPQIATIHTVEGGRKTLRKRKTLRSLRKRKTRNRQ